MSDMKTPEKDRADETEEQRREREEKEKKDGNPLDLKNSAPLPSLASFPSARERRRGSGSPKKAEAYLTLVRHSDGAPGCTLTAVDPPISSQVACERLFVRAQRAAQLIYSVGVEPTCLHPVGTALRPGRTTT